MAFNAFLDTNIIIDFLDPLRPFHEEAVQLFDSLDHGEFKGYYSESIVTTTAYVIRKDYRPDQICEIINSFAKRISLLPCADFNITQATIKLPPDFEDGLLYEIALHHQLDYFITSNTKDFKKIQKPELPVINARAFNKLLTKD